MSKKKSFALRVDPAMHDALQRWADDELRSINAQIEWALRDALRRAGRWPKADTTANNEDEPQS
ncbi:MAG: Arc family DNA binding domain-containing protein [Xanthomonadales bacterium]|jgi:hypothetical protein|nr:Arc family DNA binding domain-containing protein [Xanthomonadales bacterium]